MDTSLFSTVKITKDRLDLWIKFNYNVMLVGEMGSGKSTMAIEAFNRNNLNWVYFSGATLDPWTDVVGIPKPKLLENGETVIEYIRPQNMNDDVEAIFIDEMNRSHKKVKSALMELIQFKSINGKKFPKLRFIWAAINPEDDMDTYEVEPLDPAQLDRFHIIVNVPYEPDKEYFAQKFTKLIGNQAVSWWKQQSTDIKRLISPRRLDYALAAYADGIDISDILPRIANISKLKEMINSNETEIEWDFAYEQGDIAAIGHILNDDSLFQEVKNHILSSEIYYVSIANNLNREKISALYSESNKFAKWMERNPAIGKNKEILAEKNNTKFASPNNSDIFNDIAQILKTDYKEKMVTYCAEFNKKYVNTKIKRSTTTNTIMLNNSIGKFTPIADQFLITPEKLSMTEIKEIVDYLNYILGRIVVYNSNTMKSIGKYIIREIAGHKNLVDTDFLSVIISICQTEIPSISLTIGRIFNMDSAINHYSLAEIYKL